MKIFETFDCDDFDSPEEKGGKVSYLAIDYSLSCTSDEHITYINYAYAMVAFYVLFIPAAMAFGKWRQMSNVRASRA